MKKTTFTLLLSFSCWWLAAQCPTGDIIFSTQGQIDSFQINYPGCSEIPGKVTVSGADITDLQGLNALDSIHGCFLITNNPLLTSLHGLENLTYVGECEIPFLGSKYRYGLRITYNALLSSLSGLDNLRTVKRCITVENNPSLYALNSLDTLTSVGECQTYLSSEGWVTTHSVGVIENNRLKNITGFSSLDTLRALDISLNDSLVSLEGFKHLRAVLGPLTVIENYWSLKNFSGLDSLESVGYLWIQGNFSLENFHGLQNLKTIKGGFWGPTWAFPSFWVSGNSLIDFSGLENLQEIIGDLTIEYNENLAICNTPTICTYLLQHASQATISNNAPGCNSVEEVEAACMVSIEETSDDESVVVFSPNPAYNFLQVQINNSEKWKLSLFNLQGRQMLRQTVSGNQTISLHDWPAGLYTLRAVSGERVFSGKIVKK